jgi:hypothetical protein
VDIDTLPQDANLIGVKWVFKIKYKNAEYERHKSKNSCSWGPGIQ